MKRLKLRKMSMEKSKNVTYTFNQEGLGDEEVERRTREIKNLLYALYDQYVLVVDGGRHLQKEPSPSSSSTVSSNRSTNNRRSNPLSNWKNVVQETEEAVAKQEVDQYLEAALELIDDLDCFDILLWWKLNQFKYPVLAAIARDVLSIQVSTVASESVFSTGGRVVDCFRSSLTPKTAEGLICIQNWLLGNDIAEDIDDCTIENYEFYEGVELEHESTTTSKANACPPPPSRAKAKGKRHCCWSY
uniref:zinc finger BED domain-containing protein DAYSLEEPER-like n=1 Tax=Fragaria vesca subsp. vesca TaxID=101020 RepID=UPI0005C96798|nr:PREDICTED: zinc finger BED domain-containing protein DAYSLEEPER-like [Fragaria vesca subsp. vesca]XP_011460277.1 PREDICTED: zinc finger BED domain-containing protein DAYSLEEPER-like [Fragaria vesca subsp. vesca]